eukprot:TRINITY_DN2500_c0_g2_i3.p1 TRINITY_DN2500_c0_g2~~TRINITY_DN2500_c0_g2_i3.p1  ORF type:complete len:467 (+),score=174.15 TRINITY_DN2500_c0_g2_i3:900-2300(+)
MLSRNVAAGVMYLHSQGIIHRDIAAQNVLCSGDHSGTWIAKIADFGLARKIDQETVEDRQSPFNERYASPEVILFRKFSKASDVFSFGTMLWEIWADGEIPYATRNSEEAALQIAGGFLLNQPLGCPADLYNDVIRRCLEFHAEHRPAMSDIHDWHQNQSAASANHSRAGSTPNTASYRNHDDLGQEDVVVAEVQVVKCVGQWGARPGQFKNPQAIAELNDGRLLVTDSENGRLQSIGRHRDAVALVERWCSEQDDGRMRKPTGIAVAPDGHVYIADAILHCVHVLDNLGRWLTSFGEDRLRGPGAVKVDAKNERVLVTDWENNAVFVFGFDGTFKSKFGERGSNDGYLDCPGSLAVGAHGQLLVVDYGNNRVQVFDSNGKYVRRFGANQPLDRPRGIVFSRDGSMVAVSDYSGVLLFTSHGRFLKRIGADAELDMPSGMVFTQDGRLAVTEVKTNRITFFQIERL